jgi:two-component system sensor histidine kinase PilS (NtrC family)
VTKRVVREADRRRRLVWLIWARVVVSTLLLGLAIGFQVSAPGSLPADPFFFLIGLTYALSVVYALALPAMVRRSWLVDLEFACDAVLVTAFIHFTGGVTSYFSLLCVLPVLGAASLQFRTGGLRMALLCALLYSTLVIAQYSGSAGYVAGEWVADMRSYLPPAHVAEYTVAANAIALVAVALLAGSLAERLRSADDRLEHASHALADLQAFNQHVIQSLTSGLATTDRSGRIQTFNRAAEVITGHQSGAVCGRRVAEVLQLPADFAALLNAGLSGDAARRADYTYRTCRDEPRDIGLSAAHLITPDGRTGFLLTFQDVTAIRRLEREGRQRQQLAAVGEMAAGIAHEIRNPLASMRGSIQVLRSELELTDEQSHLMDIVLRESDRLNETIRSFLSYARPQPLSARSVDLSRLLTDTATLLRNSPEVLPSHQILLDVPDADLVVEADDAQVRQVVWNLATNGLRAMPEGGELVLRARLDTTEGGDGVALEVVDQGVGIRAEQLDSLFEPFHGSFARGSGLGLAIVHRIVSDHKGEVQVASEWGKGTTVLVKLPRLQGSTVWGQTA